MPLQVQAEVLAMGRVGAYYSLTVAAPGIPELTRPGHFLAVQVGGPASSMLLRRAFAIYRADAGVVEVVFAVHGAGTAWLAGQRPGDVLDVVGPLGTPFPVPEVARTATLVGGGYGVAPLLPLAEALRARGGEVDMVLGAGDADRLFGVQQAGRTARTVLVTTDDGSAGERGRVSDVLPALLARTASEVVYACGPMGMLRAVAEQAAAAGIPSYVAVEESMACGIGVCMTCVLPVVGDDGLTRMVRSCVEGPVFAGDRVRWDALGTVPADAVGAPR